jgi:hypothetical protein
MESYFTTDYKFENHGLVVFGYDHPKMAGKRVQDAWKAHFEPTSHLFNKKDRKVCRPQQLVRKPSRVLLKIIQRAVSKV